MDREEKKLLTTISDKVDKLIDKIFQKYGYERAYYNFILKVEILDDEFRTKNVVEILNDVEKSTCAFCGKETRYFDNELNMFLCFEHYLEKLKKE